MSKKSKPKYKNKTQFKNKPKPVSLFRSKYYWIAVALILLVFTLVYGYLNEISLEKEALMVGSIIFLIVFAFYVGFKPFKIYPKRITFMFAGAVLIGGGIWAAVVLSFATTRINTQIEGSVGGSLFLATSLMIAWISGAYIGDQIGKHNERIKIFIDEKIMKKLGR